MGLAIRPRQLVPRQLAPHRCDEHYESPARIVGYLGEPVALRRQAEQVHRARRRHARLDHTSTQVFRARVHTVALEARAGPHVPAAARGDSSPRLGGGSPFVVRRCAARYSRQLQQQASIGPLRTLTKLTRAFCQFSR
jgi:hypothetical protein